MNKKEPEHMRSQYSYRTILEAAEKNNWRIEDIIGGDKKLDFGRPFLPESLAGAERVHFLTPAEKLALNQIRGHGYLYTFGLVEEFILPFVLDHARPLLNGGDDRIRALLRFAGEEAKHIQLFKTFSHEFEQGFGTACGVIGPPREIARAVLSHHPLAVALVILQIEWMTQRHYLDSVRDNQDLDPQFKSLLRHHWMEEAQHAKIDTLIVEALAQSCTSREIEQAVTEYLEIGSMLDGGLQQQVDLDAASLTRATGRRLTAEEQEQFRAAQTQAIRWTFLGSGMTHPNFQQTLGELNAAARIQIEEIAPVFS
jgi:hypothetical protein